MSQWDAPCPTSTPRGAINIFRRKGDYWTVEYEGSVVRLRDARGLRYLAFLLEHRGQQIAAIELLRAVEGALEPPPQVAPPPADAERARSAVSKRIRAAMHRIHAHHPALGRHLMFSIRTGRRCAYLPDPDERIVWGL